MIDNPNNMKKILPIFLGKSKIAIRVIDWFVTNYAKKKNIIYNISNSDTPIYFNVYLDYKSQLKGYRKKLFDPFCRKKRITFYYQANKCITTTIGQLNFFRWALSNKVLDYIDKHYDEITCDMNSYCKYSSEKNNKRHELSESATNTLSCHSMKVTISFDI